MEEVTIYKAVNQKDRNDAFNFFSKRILETYGNEPSPLDKEIEILVAKTSKEIIGTIGFHFSALYDNLPCSSIYQLPSDSFLAGNVCFISRWSARENKTGLILSYISAEYILSRNSLFGFSVLKPKVAMYLNSISNNAWHEIKGLTLKEYNIPIEDRKYFLEGPKPSLYRASIQSYFSSLSRSPTIKKAMKNVRIKF